MASGEGQLIAGNTAFGSVKGTEYLKNILGVDGIFVVKTATKRFPKREIELIMKDWPAGTSIVLQSQFNEKNVLAIGYKYTSKAVVCFVASVAADLTSNGDPYVSKYLSEEYKTTKLETSSVHRSVVIIIPLQISLTSTIRFVKVFYVWRSTGVLMMVSFVLIRQLSV